MKSITYNSNHLGAISSGLCILHCVATPLLFFSKAQSALICCHETPVWWQSFNYFFIIVSFLAVYNSVLNSSNNFIKVLLSGFWVLLCLLILNEQFEIMPFSEFYTYLLAFSLGFLHIYNLKYCRCKDDDCCAQK